MYFQRILGSRLLAPASRRKIRLLFGPRQAGKTALLRHAVPGAHHIDLGAPSDRRRDEGDPGRLGRELLALPRGVRNVVVDEVQKVPAILDEIQSLYDHRPERFAFFLTGSSARKLRTHSANLLPGRSHLFRLGPVSLLETERKGSVKSVLGPAHVREERIEHGKLELPMLSEVETNSTPPGLSAKWNMEMRRSCSSGFR